MNAEAAWAGCSVTLLSNFPYDSEDSYNRQRHDKLAKELEQPLPYKHTYCRAWMVMLCSQQMRAKALLEAHGFRVLVEMASGHPEKPESNNCNGGTVYILFKEKT